ncbi:hypothetical protein B0W44_04025 [Novibacillus thermophilus]|uniref:Uncharacterized protein n=1 Tax=Novibacillus thermophilus TaxID=1471761 RepID=A0A1U9K4V5_9BACL|nr:hypothetical protein B0W44_04025 [Novibacillus thermophilus]
MKWKKYNYLFRKGEKYFRVSPLDIQKASDWFQKYGTWSVFMWIFDLEYPVSLCRCLRWGILMVIVISELINQFLG